MKRPFRSKTTQQLVEISKSNWNDLNCLNNVIDELTYRTRSLARRLQNGLTLRVKILSAGEIKTLPRLDLPPCIDDQTPPTDPDMTSKLHKRIRELSNENNRLRSIDLDDFIYLRSLATGKCLFAVVCRPGCSHEHEGQYDFAEPLAVFEANHVIGRKILDGYYQAGDVIQLGEGGPKYVIIVVNKALEDTNLG